MTKMNDRLPRFNRRGWPLLTWLLMLSAIVGAVTGVQAQAPDTYAAEYPVSVNLDGDFSEWQGVETVRVTTGPQMTADPNLNGAFEFAAVADADNLYVLLRVEDANIVAGQHGVMYWFEDSVEIYVNGTGDLELTSYAPGVAQITVPAVNIGRPVDQSLIVGINHESVPARAAVVATDNGYAMEVAIPLRTNVWTLDPASDVPIGFQIQVNSSSGGDRDAKLSWSPRDQSEDRSYTDPSVFGQLVFQDSGRPATSGQPLAEPTAAPTEQPAAQGNFSVQGTTILNPQGQPFVAKGVNVNGYNWVWTRPTAPDVDLIGDCWGFNLVRVNSFLFSGQVPYPQYDVNNDLDAIVQAYTSRGIVVVFEGHDRIGAYYEGDDLNALVSWFTDLANRYKDNPYVWFNVMNEPGGWQEVNAEKWLRVHQEVIHAVRNVVGADNIIIVEGAHGGQDASGQHGGLVSDADSAILSLSDQILNFGGQSYENIVFSIHTYDQWNYGDAKLADFFDRVQARNLAMIVGEFGVRTNADTTAAFRSTFNTAVPRGIGRVVWHWDGGDNNDLTTNTSQGGGWEINDCANPTNLSEMGQAVWNDNHGG